MAQHELTVLANLSRLQSKAESLGLNLEVKY